MNRPGLPAPAAPAHAAFPLYVRYVVVGLYGELEPEIRQMETALDINRARVVRDRWLDQHFDGPIRLWELQPGAHFIEVGWPE